MLEAIKLVHAKIKNDLEEGNKLSRCNSINTLSRCDSINTLSRCNSINTLSHTDNSLKRMASISVFNQPNVSSKDNNIFKIKSDSYLTDRKIKKTLSLGEFNKIFEKYKKRSFNPRLPPYLKR
jgi:hypothetical protein